MQELHTLTQIATDEEEAALRFLHAKIIRRLQEAKPHHSLPEAELASCPEHQQPLSRLGGWQTFLEHVLTPGMLHCQVREV